MEKTPTETKPVAPVEVTEVVEEKESEEAAKERKRKEFEAKRQELLNEKVTFINFLAIHNRLEKLPKSIYVFVIATLMGCQIHFF